MKLRRIILGLVVSVILYLLLYTLFEYKSSDTVWENLERHWKGALTVGIIASVAEYVLYNVMGIKDPEPNK